MTTSHYVSRVVNLIPASSQRLWTIGPEEASRRLLAADVDEVLAIDGSFALVAQDGERVLLARSLDRPMRYFLAKAVDGPVLIVAERESQVSYVDEILSEDFARQTLASSAVEVVARDAAQVQYVSLQLLGTNGRDLIHGLGGNDTIFGFGGDDKFVGGDGDDYLSGGNGSFSGFTEDATDDQMKKQDEEYRNSRKDLQQKVQWSLTLGVPFLFAGFGLFRWNVRQSRKQRTKTKG